MKRKLLHLLTLLACLSIGIFLIPRLHDYFTFGPDQKPIQGAHPLEEEKVFLSSQMDFSVKLFQGAAAKSDYENVLVSPLSAMQALSMTANGAANETLHEMTTVLAGDLSISELNENLQLYTELLPSSDKYRLHLANSIWIRDELSVDDSFLETNKTYYHADIFTEPFSKQTSEKINRWVKRNTSGKIEEIVDEIEQDTVMYLINALSFEAEWETIYKDAAVHTRDFYPEDSKPQQVEMMNSCESLYLKDDQAVGFIKNYKDSAYRFVALLPNEDISLSEYIDSLTGDTLFLTLTNAVETNVVVTLPKFSHEYELSMNDILKEMGMKSAFDVQNADFSNMEGSERNALYISEVLQKTFISVDEKGTTAGAATSVSMKDGSAGPEGEIVTLNRPFLYLILDGNTNLPVFIGTVTKF